MLIALSVLMTVAVLAAVAYPLFGRTAPLNVVGASGEQLQELLAQREAALLALRDLRFDEQVGKLSPEDMAAFEQDLRSRAADVLKRLDQFEAAMDGEMGGRTSVTKSAGVASAAGRTCPSCHRPVKLDDLFCTGCGLPLRK